MTDIISRAKRISADDQHPSPWEFLPGTEQTQNGDVVESVLIDSNNEDIAEGISEKAGELLAFAPEAVEMLAEEKYVWSVQVFMSGRWIFMVTLNTGNSLEEAAKWFPSRERAEYFASLWEPDTPARVVKRRVSPVVVDG